MSNALSQLTRPASQPTTGPAAEIAEMLTGPAAGLLALGLCVMVAWVTVRLARPRKFLLGDAPGRQNSLNVLHVIGVYLIHYLCQSALFRVLTTATGADPKAASMPVMMVAGVFGQVALAAAAVGVGMMCFRHGLDRGMGLTLRRWKWDLARSVVGYLVVIPGVLALMFLSVLLFHAWGLDLKREHTLLTFLRKDTSWWRFVALATAVVFAPIAEELFFRGLLQSMFKRYFDGRPWPAVLATSAIFAAVHYSQPQAVASLFLLSVGLGYNYERTGRLTGPILMHAIFNAVSIYLSPQ